MKNLYPLSVLRSYTYCCSAVPCTSTCHIVTNTRYPGTWYWCIPGMWDPAVDATVRLFRLETATTFFLGWAECMTRQVFWVEAWRQASWMMEVWQDGSDWSPPSCQMLDRLGLLLPIMIARRRSIVRRSYQKDLTRSDVTVLQYEETISYDLVETVIPSWDILTISIHGGWTRPVTHRKTRK